VSGGKVLLRIEGVIQSADDALLNLGTAEILTGRQQRRQVESVRIAVALGQVDAEDLNPLLGRRQIHVKDFVEAAFAQQFRRQLGDLICGGNNEDGGALF